MPGTDLDRVSGVGVDVPILFGYRSDADLLSGWVGLRASLDHWSGNVSLDDAPTLKLRADRLSAGPLLGNNVSSLVRETQITFDIAAT